MNPMVDAWTIIIKGNGCDECGKSGCRAKMCCDNCGKNKCSECMEKQGGCA